ncbi:SDR family NAD(P)-dependent oxidoreductase [Streptomyces liangshanensis]|uniref:SDR family NAD(P)-dependent oxidoreductase n=1 Tax=Streptomyces liangshanensis TaxID=2717324 RepID=UPI0036DF7FD7
MAGTGRMQGRNALVTGSTGGIGRAVALALAREGATVVVSGRDAERGEDIVRRVEDEGGKAVFVQADLSAGGQAVRDLARDAAEAVGVIDVLVNNAAVLIPAQSMLEATEEEIDRALAVNVKAPFLLTAALVPSMVERGGGAVVNMGSINGETGMSVAALYGASKAALHSLTKSWAAELAAQGVRVNTVAPGPTVTEHNAAYSELLEGLTKAHPQRRPGTAEEVAAAVVFLAGDDAAHIHGATLPVDGGFLAV